ncbi:MAG: response regulator [Calditrichae bacterium]|nr:response regulator [Calditrichia bacterium]
MTIDQQDYLNEIKANITSEDRIKADIIMSHIFECDIELQRAILEVLSDTNSAFTISYILQMLETAGQLKIDESEIIFRLQNMLIEAPDNISQLYFYPDLWNKIDIIDLVSELQHVPSVPFLIELLNGDINLEKTEKIIVALGRIGSPETVNTISEYLYQENRILQFLAINALQDIGTSEAVYALAQRLGSDNQLDERIIDVFAKLQDEISLEQLNNLLKRTDPHIKNYVKTRIINIGQKTIPLLLNNIHDFDNAEFVIHSLNILSKIGDESSVNAIRQLLYNQPENANIRFAAYEALGMLPLAKGVYILSNGLMDADDMVRNAAAKAIERNNNSLLRSGIRNLIKNKDQNAQRITAAFINAEADSVFTHLIEDDIFRELAQNYLNEHAHPDIKKHFCAIVKSSGKTPIADLDSPKEEVKRLHIAVVDDSLMLLKIYKNNLYDIGYETSLFEFPEQALENIIKNKPDLVITDLNMPVLTGAELTAKLREKYSREELPVILATTQNDQSETEKAFAAGINDVIYKPFTKEQLAEKINLFLAVTPAL